MTPEALSAYLLGKGLDPDAVQDTILEYMTWQGPPILHPKTWAWRRVWWRTKDGYRQQSGRGTRIDLPANLVSILPDPLTQAERRQRIERYATQTGEEVEQGQGSYGVPAKRAPKWKWDITKQRNC